jgi:hypothetical protein
MRTWTRLAMAVVLVVGGLVGFTPAPASAAPICYGGSCDYWDPGTAGCIPGSVVRSEMTIQSWRYKVVYSPACNAGWAEVTNSSNYCPARYLHLQVRQASTSSSPVVSRRVTSTSDCLLNRRTAQTTMASFNYWLQTCASNVNDDIFPAGRCTGIV